MRDYGFVVQNVCLLVVTRSSSVYDHIVAELATGVAFGLRVEELQKEEFN